MSVNLVAGRRFACSTASVLALVALAGCGSSSNDSSSTPASASTSAKAPDAGSASGLAVEQKIVDAAESSAALGRDVGSVTPGDITAATTDQINPTPYKAGQTPKKVITISSASTSPTTERQAAIELAMLKKLGWSGEKVAAGNDFSPQSFQRAMTNAIAKKPDIIITNGIAGAPISKQLSAAKAAGIFTIGVNVDESAGPGYQQIIGSGWGLGAAVLASKMIVDAAGKPNIHWFNFPQFQFLAASQGVAFTHSVCPTCAVKQEDIDAAKLIDPVSLGQTITSTIQANPKLTAVAYPGDLAASPIQQAIGRSANPKVKQYGVTFTGAALQSLKAGALPVMVGSPSAWSSVQAVDMALRHATGKPPLAEDSEDLKIGAMMMTPDTVPAGKLDDAAVDRWAVKQFDFLAPYGDAWGVDLTSTI